MPIYEYQCNSCHYQMEAFQNVRDPSLKECPSCKKQELQKLISSTSFHLKGDGWYVTDYKDKGKKDKKTTPTEKKDSDKSGQESKEQSKGQNKETSTSGKKDQGDAK